MKKSYDKLPLVAKIITVIGSFLVFCTLIAGISALKSMHLAEISVEIKPGQDCQLDSRAYAGSPEGFLPLENNGFPGKTKAKSLWISVPYNQKENIEGAIVRIGRETYEYTGEEFANQWQELDAETEGIMQDEYDANRTVLAWFQLSADQISPGSILPCMKGIVNYRGDFEFLLFPLVLGMFMTFLVFLLFSNRISAFNFTFNALLFMLLYFLISALLLPEGINAVFVSEMSAIAGIFTIICAFFYPLFFKRSRHISFIKDSEKLNLHDFIYVLIPLTPVIQYIFLNQEELSLRDSFLVFGFFAVISVIFCAIIPAILSVFAPKKVFSILSSGFLYVIFNMTALSAGYSWSGRGKPEIQAGVFIVVVAVLFLLALLPRKIFSSAVAAFFIINALGGFLGMNVDEDKTDGGQKSHVLEVLGEKEAVKKKHVFLLVFEAYSNFETMLQYGFDNSEQIEFLRSSGFKVFHGNYSLGPCTLTSISRLLSIDNDPQGNIRKHIVGGIVPEILKSQGYRTFCRIPNNYLYRGLNSGDIKYDNYYPELIASETLWIVIRAVLEGEFRHTAGFAEFETSRYQTYLEKKREVLAGSHKKPVFMYSHSGVPGHSQTSGKCLPDEKYLHFAGIKKANEEIREDIKTIIENNPDAIVIIAGDHGPYLTKNCASLVYHSTHEIDRNDVQDRYGSFLAIRWPEQEYGDKYDIAVFQDVFPAVLSYIYGDDSIFDAIRIQDRIISDKDVTGQVYVQDGIIFGGINDQEPLFARSLGIEPASAVLESGSNAVASLTGGAFQGTYLLSREGQIENNQDLNWEKISDMTADKLLAGNIAGSGLPEIAGIFPGHGLWYYSFVHRAWINILGNAYSYVDFALSKSPGGGKCRIFVSLHGLGFYSVNAEGQCQRILPVAADSILAGNFNKAEELLFLSVKDNGSLDGLYLYYPGGSEFIRIVRESPVQMVSGDLDGDGYDELLCSFEGKGTYLGLFSSRDAGGDRKVLKDNPEFLVADGIRVNHKMLSLIGLYYMRISKELPLDGQGTGFGDIAPGPGKEVLMSYSNATYYYTLDKNRWVKITDMPFNLIITGRFTQGRYDDIIGQDVSGKGIFLFKSSEGKWENIAPSARASAMHAF